MLQATWVCLVVPRWKRRWLKAASAGRASYPRPPPRRLAKSWPIAWLKMAWILRLASGSHKMGRNSSWGPFTGHDVGMDTTSKAHQPNPSKQELATSDCFLHAHWHVVRMSDSRSYPDYVTSILVSYALGSPQPHSNYLADGVSLGQLVFGVFVGCPCPVFVWKMTE